VISIDGDTAHGSCRSIPGFDMLEALSACSTHLDQFGGHRAAAGLTLGRSRIRAFRDDLTRWADDRLGPDDLRPRLRIDGQLGFRQLTPRLYDSLCQLAPFGVGNPKPTFWTPAAQLADGPRRMKERHLSMSLRHDGVALRGVFWRAAERAADIAAARDGLDVAYTIERNMFNGHTSIEISLADVRASAAGPR
jgi:single-stranded-DNA-specific exonuclease